MGFAGLISGRFEGMWYGDAQLDDVLDLGTSELRARLLSMLYTSSTQQPWKFDDAFHFEYLDKSFTSTSLICNIHFL